VRLGFQALAPLAMAALTKAAIGAITAVAVVALLDAAVSGVRSGRLQRAWGAIDDRLDRDRDGSSADDVGRSALSGAKRTGKAAVSLGRKVGTSKTVRKAASTAASRGKRAAAAGAQQASRQGKRALKKLFGR
jgi:hypothetical protein